MNTRPTRITQSTATLIDNIFVSEKLHKYFEPAVILDDISDHLPTLDLLKQTELLDNKLIEFESCNLMASKVKMINQELLKVDWTRHLSLENSSDNFDLFLAKVNEITGSISPLKKFHISAKRKYIEPWMTQGLEISGRHKTKLYKESIKATVICDDLDKYKS